MKKNKGFTLIELLVVITIMGVLAAIGLSSYRVASQKARDSRRQADIQSIRSSLEVFKSDSVDGLYPSSGEYNNTDFGPYFSNGKIPSDPNLSAVTEDYKYTPLSGGAGYTIEFYTELPVDGVTDHMVYSPK